MTTRTLCTALLLAFLNAVPAGQENHFYHFEMTVSSQSASAITAEMLAIQPETNTEDALDAECRGEVTAGSVRFYTDGTVPSNTVGFLAPPVTPSQSADSTLHLDGRLIFLASPDEMRLWRGVSAFSAPSIIWWECVFPQHTVPEQPQP